MSRRILLPLLVLALVVGGCGDDGDDARTVAGDGTPEATALDETTTTSMRDEGPARPLELRPVLRLVVPMDDDVVPKGCRTPAEEWALDREVHAPELDGEEVVACHLLGPTELADDIVASATAEEIDPTDEVFWTVSVVIGDDHLDRFNAVAETCFETAPTCPTGQLAIVSDGTVISAPSVNAPSFDPQISITGDFDQAGAEELAARLG